MIEQSSRLEKLVDELRLARIEAESANRLKSRFLVSCHWARFVDMSLCPLIQSMIRNVLSICGEMVLVASDVQPERHVFAFWCPVCIHLKPT